MKSRLNVIDVGDEVIYRPAFGTEPATIAKVVGLTLTEDAREKDGIQIDTAFTRDVEANRVVFDLESGKHAEPRWCYSEQVEMSRPPGGGPVGYMRGLRNV